MEKKTYSKVFTQFETQAMAFGRVKVGLKGTDLFVRGDDERLVIFKKTNDPYKPQPVLTLYVKASESPDDVGFKLLSKTEVWVSGMDIAWAIMDHITPILFSSTARLSLATARSSEAVKTEPQ